MTRVLIGELRKLQGSLALLLALAVPGLLGVLVLLAVAAAEKVPAWHSIVSGLALPLWALFLLPMAVAAFTTLIAQIEYKGRGWDHILALPIGRWRFFAAKAIVCVAAFIAMTAMVMLCAVAGGLIGGTLTGRMPPGPIPWQRMVDATLSVTAAGLLLVALQLWVALRSANFVVPLAFGIGGTLVSLGVAMTGTDKADWFPWVLPSRSLGVDNMQYLLIGGIGGAAVFVLMVLDLQRRAFK
ncbi:MAG TPA: ABC transporter permease [Allosphingosinicella sp.]|nr:ABC transporter permease [Allosphingosinicella sp.]